MRIAMFTDTYTPQVNGVVTSIKAFKAELERQGHEVEVWAPTAIGAPAEPGIHRIRSFTFAPYPEYKISVPNPRVLYEFERFEADVVHVHSPISAGTLGIGLARRLSLPAVGTFHTVLPEYMHYLVKSRLQELFLKSAKRFAWDYCRWFYNLCDAVVAPSAATARLLRERGISEPIAVIPTGLRPSKPASRQAAKEFRLRHGFGGKLLLHVGRVTREKNIEAIIDAVLELPDVTLAVASDGPHRRSLQAHAKRAGLGERVRFLGYLSQDELAAAYAAADLFVCASKSETQGIVLLEAAAAGLPIVALDAPAVSDFIRENRAGRIAKEERFAQAIAAALDDRQLRRRSRGRAKAIAKKYSIERCAHKLVRLYNKVASAKASQERTAS
ncbi:MAG: glycosyltransferase [Candidatus Aenigmatarchaeota archaeon]